MHPQTSSFRETDECVNLVSLTNAASPKELALPIGGPPDVVHAPILPTYCLPRLLFAVFLFTTGIAMTIPVRHKMILQAAQNNASQAALFTGAVESVQSILSILVAPILGAVSDVIGRKPVLILSHTGEFAGLILMSQFKTSLAAIATAYMAIALTSTYMIIISAIIVDTSAECSLTTTTSFGFLFATFGLCMFLGTAAGGIVESSLYFGSSFHIAACTTLLAAVYVYLFVPETRWIQHGNNLPALGGSTPGNLFEKALEAIRKTNINPFPRILSFARESEALQWLGLTLCITSIAQSGLRSIVYLYTHEKLGWDLPQYATFLSSVGLSVLVSQAVIVWPIVKMFGERMAIMMGMACDAASYLVYAFAKTTRDMYIGLLLGAVGLVWDAALKGVLARQATADRQGVLQGSISAVKDVVAPLSPVLTSVLFSVGQRNGILGLPLFVMGFVYVLGMGCARVALWKSCLR